MTRFLISFFIISIFSVNVQAKMILVTAATSSFGKAISVHLASEGYNLVLVGRNQGKLNNLKNEILTTHKNSNIITVLLDFSDIKKIKPSLDLVPSNLEGVILIGPRPELSQNDIPSPAEWTKAFKETFIAPLESLKFLIPRIKNNGSIVVISGSTSKDYLKAYPNTNIIRLAWSGEIKNIMYFVASRRIRVNAISPGPILTSHHFAKITADASKYNIPFDEQLKKNSSSIPLGTYGSLNDVAYLVHFLISPKSNHINGSNLLLDGGASNTY